eukprot:6450564-Pyramimonas_sp.AAC.1
MVQGTAPRDKTAEPYNIKEKERRDFDIITPPGTPWTPRGSAGAAISAASAAAPAASMAAPRSAGQLAQNAAGQPAQGELSGATCLRVGGANGVQRALGKDARVQSHEDQHRVSSSD